jgi:predicted nuclease of predicted toxin-antitoxin system
MKLLLDENLSRRLIPFLQNDFPGSTQVTLVGLEKTSDIEIWKYAQAHQFVIVTRDADFYELSLHYQLDPSKVIWLRVANVSKDVVLKLLLNNKIFLSEQLTNFGKLCVQLY